MNNKINNKTIKEEYSKTVLNTINIENLIKNFQIDDLNGISDYLLDTWKELYLYSDDIIKGLNFITFKRVRILFNNYISIINYLEFYLNVYLCYLIKIIVDI